MQQLLGMHGQCSDPVRDAVQQTDSNCLQARAQKAPSAQQQSDTQHMQRLVMHLVPIQPVQHGSGALVLPLLQPHPPSPASPAAAAVMLGTSCKLAHGNRFNAPQAASALLLLQQLLAPTAAAGH
jgi:hypothetical protein